MITVEPANLTVGATAKVCVKNSSKPPGSTIQVQIDNGEGATQQLDIVLGAGGNGCADWIVPDWSAANFNYSTCLEVAKVIAPAGQ